MSRAEEVHSKIYATKLQLNGRAPFAQPWTVNVTSLPSRKVGPAGGRRQPCAAGPEAKKLRPDFAGATTFEGPPG